MTTFEVGRAPVEIYLGVTYTIGVTYFSQRFSSNFKRAVLRAQVELGDAPQLVSRASYAYEHVGRAYRGRSARYGCVPWPSVSAIVGASENCCEKNVSESKILVATCENLPSPIV